MSSSPSISSPSLFRDSLKNHPLIMDGATATLIYAAGFSGLPDLLSLSSPDTLSRIHRDYLAAGADIIRTDTFNANRFSFASMNIDADPEEINRTAAGIARREADTFTNSTGRRRFVAGCIGAGPAIDSETGAALLEESVAEQAAVLAEAWADLIILETIHNPLNGEAALSGICRVREKYANLPVIASVTISAATGKLPSGTSPEDFFRNISRFAPDVIGINCGDSPEKMIPAVRTLAATSNLPLSFCPSAGLPCREGEHILDPDNFARIMRPLIDEGIIHIAGGCCGTRPEHISALDLIVFPRRSH